MIGFHENRASGNVSILVDGERRSVTAIRKGAANEHTAKAWLIRLGYEVFSNVSPEGPADLVAVKFEQSETIYVDVKSQSFDINAESSQIYRDRNRLYGIRYLVVSDDGDCRWVDPEKSTSLGRRYYAASAQPSGKSAMVEDHQLTAYASGLIAISGIQSGDIPFGALPSTREWTNSRTGEACRVLQVPGSNKEAVWKDLIMNYESPSWTDGVFYPPDAPGWLLDIIPAA